MVLFCNKVSTCGLFLNENFRRRKKPLDSAFQTCQSDHVFGSQVCSSERGFGFRKMNHQGQAVRVTGFRVQTLPGKLKGPKSPGTALQLKTRGCSRKKAGGRALKNA
jgi:hypothetical protein